MTYEQLQAWLEQLRTNNPGREDVNLAITSLETIIAKPLDQQTINKIMNTLYALIDIDAKRAIQYSIELTAGILYEAFQRPSTAKEFADSYPQMVEEDREISPDILTEKKRPIALLDVDHTLLFDDSFNENLIASLKKNGIMDVYLFTDMRFRKLEALERMRLVQQLEDKGFKVHGVITPMDLVWPHMTAENISAFDQEVLKSRYKGKFAGKEFDDFLDTIKDDLPFIAAIRNYSPQDCLPSSSYSDAVAAIHNLPEGAPENTPMPDMLLERSSYGKAFGDCHAERMNFAHTKALMLDMFLHHKPDWVSSVLIADDNINVIQAVGEYKERMQPDIPITAIPVTSNALEVSYYEQAIDKHFSLDPQFLIIKSIENKIDQHIESLNRSTWNIFLSSPEAKTKALEVLKSNLRESYHRREPISIENIIVDWEKSLKFIDRTSNQKVSIAKVIAQHRNFFLPESREEETSTQSFIKRLKDEFSSTTIHQSVEANTHPYSPS